MHRGDHYTAVIKWNGQDYFYDGLNYLLPLEGRHKQGKKPQFALYLLVPTPPEYTFARTETRSPQFGSRTETPVQSDDDSLDEGWPNNELFD